MKHLRSYKIYESNTMLDTIGDILSDIEDNGFDVRYYFNRSHSLNIDIKSGGEIKYLRGSSFNWSDISNAIEHVTNYLKDCSYDLVEIQYFSTYEDKNNGNLISVDSLSDMYDESIMCTENGPPDIRITYGTKYEKSSLKLGSGGYLGDF